LSISSPEPFLPRLSRCLHNSHLTAKYRPGKGARATGKTGNVLNIRLRSPPDG
jgi:hypothetical protein